MSRVSSIFTMGRQALSNNQTALQTVSHNIANKSTEGYSRQRVDFQTNDAVGWGKDRVGTGAHVGKVQRTTNDFLEKQIGGEMNKAGFYDTQGQALNRIEQIFNEQNGKGLNNFIGEFFNSFREFSNNPENLASRTLVKENAAAASKEFGRVSHQLKSVQSEMDQDLITQTNQINAMSSEISSLNEKILTVEVTGASANDERDRRDLLVKQMGQKLNIHIGESDNGMVNITAGNSAILVSGVDHGELKAVATARREANTVHPLKRESNFDIVYQQDPFSEAFVVTDQFTGGEIGGTIHTRDKVINDLLGKVDNMAFTLTTKVNEAHQIGYNKYNETGANFFQELEAQDDAAAKIDLDKGIYQDVNNIAAGAIEGAPGDNRVAVVISSLQSQNVMDDGKANLDDYFNGVVGELAVQTNKTNGMVEHQKNIVDQLKNIRESVSGVSLDEEAIKMIEFQKAYEASAKMIKVADEMMQTVLDLKR